MYARETKNIQVMLPIAYTDKQEFTLKKENNFPWNYKKAKMQVTASEGESKQTMQLCCIISFHCFAEKHQHFFMQNMWKLLPLEFRPRSMRPSLSSDQGRNSALL